MRRFQRSHSDSSFDSISIEETLAFGMFPFAKLSKSFQGFFIENLFTTWRRRFFRRWDSIFREHYANLMRRVSRPESFAWKIRETWKVTRVDGRNIETSLQAFPLGIVIKKVFCPFSAISFIKIIQTITLMTWSFRKGQKEEKAKLFTS